MPVCGSKKKHVDFPINLSLCALVEACTLKGLLIQMFYSAYTNKKAWPILLYTFISTLIYCFAGEC